MEQIIQKTIDNLNKRGFLAEYAETSADAKARVMELVKGAESIGRRSDKLRFIVPF